jgi:hypothetical protein
VPEEIVAAPLLPELDQEEPEYVPPVEINTFTSDESVLGEAVSRYAKILSFDLTTLCRMSVGMVSPHWQQEGGSHISSAHLEAKQVVSVASVSVSVSAEHPLVLVLVRCRYPPPQVAEHEPHVCHGLKVQVASGEGAGVPAVGAAVDGDGVDATATGAISTSASFRIEAAGLFVFM